MPDYTVSQCINYFGMVDGRRLRNTIRGCKGCAARNYNVSRDLLGCKLFLPITTGLIKYIFLLQLIDFINQNYSIVLQFNP